MTEEMRNMNILLVEDDAKLGMLLQYKLKKQFHSVDWVKDGATAAAYIEAGAYDLFVLDWMVPGRTGVELCRDIRERRCGAPILMLTARDAVQDRVEGLFSGADDYLVKPFAFEELFARIHALGRRKETRWNADTAMVDDLTVWMQTCEVERQGIPLSLTRREFQLLALLVSHAGQVLSREQLIDRVWGVDADVTPNAVDAAIKLLRKKVDGPFERKLIQSVRGLGYRIEKK